jgi:RNA-directed DNA polymerase
LVSGREPVEEERPTAKDKVGEILVHRNKGARPEVRDRLNRLLRGWTSYFGYGTWLLAYRAIDHHVYDRVRNFLVHRHKVQRRGTHCLPAGIVFGEFGVLHLISVDLGPRRVL